tara:strand:+ start:928 stop:1296 length:369 start_codon:yes stop_codon:yes gene_type:complete
MVPVVVNRMNPDMLQKFIAFRLECCQEELDETKNALDNRDKEEIVDGLIDLIVFAAGTLDILKVDGQKAWEEVYKANMNKQVGIKPERPNPYGLPDLIKPDNWEAPTHGENTGILGKVFSKD